MFEHASVVTIADLYAKDPIFAGLKNQHSELNTKTDELNLLVLNGIKVPELRELKRKKLEIRKKIERIYNHRVAQEAA